jgi:hypothetical protein
MNSPLGVFEPLLLLVFTLMLLVGIAGGNPGIVLKPVFDILGQLLGAFISLLCTAVTALIRVGIGLALSAGQKLLDGLQESSKRNINR